jgi:hypothetical protein
MCGDAAEGPTVQQRVCCGAGQQLVTKEFASVDTVVKAGGCSSVEIGSAVV